MNPPVEAPTSAQSRPLDLDPERVEGVPKLLSAPGDVRRRALDIELGIGGHELPGLVVPGNEAREHERLGLAPALCQASLDQENVEPLTRGFQCDRPRELVPPGGEQMPTWLLVLIIVLVVLALFGGFGYSRR